MADASRRKWGERDRSPKTKDKVLVAKQLEPKPGYDEYLSLLHQKNRFVQEMKSKPKSKIEMERREHGFSVYVNGPHQKPPKTGSKSSGDSRRCKSSAGNPADREGVEYRSKTALIKSPRKNWAITPLEIQRQEGEAVKLYAPDDVSGEYEDDFDSDSDPDDSDNAGDNSNRLRPDEKGDNRRRLPFLRDNKLIMSISDVSVLRQSLQMASLTLSSDSDSDAESIEEVITGSAGLEADAEIVFDFERMTAPKDPTPFRCASVPATNSQTNIGGVSSRNNDIVMRMDKPIASAARPLSAVGRVPLTDPVLPSFEDRHHVLQALKEENSKLLVTKPPERLKSIEERVLNMDHSHQKIFLKTLKKIEAASPKASLDLDSTLRKSQEVTDAVRIEILSNWGHAHLVGLTEIQVFGTTGQRVPLDALSLSVEGAFLNCDDSSVVFNNKLKTTKERNMLLLQLDPERKRIPVLSFSVPSRVASMKLWNYNRSLNHLNIGVKEARVFVNSSLVFEGEVEKGCGNQVFDYATVISVLDTGDHNIKKTSVDFTSDSIQTTGGPESENKNLSSTFMIDSSVNVADSLSFGATLPDSFVPEVYESQRESVRDSASFVSASSVGDVEPRSATRMVVASPNDNLVRPSISQSGGGCLSDGSSRLSLNQLEDLSQSDDVGRRSGSQSRQTPVKSVSQRGVPTERDQRDSVSGSNKTLEFLRRANEQSRSSTSSHGRSSPTLKGIRRPDWLTKSSKKTEAPGCTGPTWLPPKSEPSPTSEFEVADDKEEERWRIKATLAKQGSLSEFKDDAERKPKPGRRPRIGLEDSWSSLSLFDRSQKGRLSLDLEGDSIDTYLSGGVHGGDESTAERLGVLSEEDMETDEEDAAFIIPELPAGRVLDIEILSTWGDRFYVGLNGIEIFSSHGEPVPIEHISADPSDINVLPEFSNDPRVVTNLLDGTNKTRDDTHMWLAPFTRDRVNKISMIFKEKCSIAMIRVWNYNKSRIHSYRGVKKAVISLDKRCIFRGEIERACGGVMGGTEVFGDTILFTTDERILEAVSCFDETFDAHGFGEEDAEHLESNYHRPSTAGEDEKEIRPFTAISKPIVAPEAKHIVKDDGVCIYTVKEIKLEFLETWGDPHYFGLTGLEVVGPEWQSLPLTLSMLKGNPSDLHSLPGHELDDRTLDKLIDGVDITTADTHMWMAPFTEGSQHTLTITFAQASHVVGLRVWNYNKSPEDTYRGVQYMRVFMDDVDISPESGFLVRKGLGACYFDFVQEITFRTRSSSETTPSKQVARPIVNASPRDSFDYEAPGMPTGFIFQLHLISSCGDLYYIGLNGLEFYDEEGRLIQMEENNIAAYPDSVNVLDNVSGDLRTPEKLIDGVNSVKDGPHMWLAPILPGVTNRVFVIFDHPTTVSVIKLWNYGKTPERGVKDFGLLVDDLLVYNGQLKPVTKAATGIIPTCDVTQQHYSIVFKEGVLPPSEKHTVISNRNGEQEVQLTNDKKIVEQPLHVETNRKVDQALRPTTSVVRGKKAR